MPAEPPAAASLVEGCAGPQALAAVTAALDPLHSAALDQMLVELRSCVEANQVGVGGASQGMRGCVPRLHAHVWVVPREACAAVCPACTRMCGCSCRPGGALQGARVCGGVLAHECVCAAAWGRA